MTWCICGPYQFIGLGLGLGLLLATISKFQLYSILDITEYVFCRNDFRAKYRICEMEGEGTLDGGDVLFTGTS